MISIISRKYFSEWGNGTSFGSNLTDFASHLKGSVGEKLKSVTRVRAALIAETNEFNQFEVQNGSILKRFSGSWIEDGFEIGQSISFVKDWTGVQTNNAASIEWSGTVVSLNDNELEFTTGGTAPLGQKSDHALICTDKFGAINYSFGFVENSASDNFISPYTNDKQFYYYGSIDTVTPTEHTMIVGGGNSASKTWYSGDATVQYISSSDPKSIGVNYLHEYEITQILVINPVFIEDYTDSLDNGTQPDDYNKENSIKHICEYEFRTTLTNPNTTVKITDNITKGSVGWFGENYNGFNDIYSISNLAYTDVESGESVDSLQLHQKTRVTGRVNGTGFTNTSKLGVLFFWAAPFSVYGDKRVNFQDTFLYDSIISTMISGAVETTGANRIKRFELNYVSATRVDFEIDIEFSSDEKDLINPDLLETVSDNYFIGIQAGNTNNVDTSNKTIVQADWQEFVINNDEAGLITFSNQQFYPHNINDTDNGFTDYKGWKQDGILYSCSIEKSLLCTFKNVQVRLVAYKESNQFDLQKFIFNVDEKVLVNNGVAEYEKLEVDTTRGFQLADGDQFNQVYLFFDDPSGSTQNVELKCGIKFDWQSWIKLPGADTIFYDASLDSKGLGQDSSRYIGNGYTLRLMIDVDVEYNSTTRYTDISPELDIYNWGLEDDDPEEWTALIQTFDEDDNNLSGAVLKNADTKFKITWTPQSGDTSTFNNIWAIHRIETVFSQGYNQIDELSSIRDSRLGNLLKPLNGETLLKVTDDGTSVVTECMIDNTKLGAGSYNISGRLGSEPVYPLYDIARDIKQLSDTEYILFNCPDNGVALSNSLRIATFNSDGVIISEEAIALNGAFTYQNWRMQVSEITTNGRKNFYAVCFTGTSTDLYEFVYNGTVYTQTQIYSQNIGGSGPTSIRIDDALSPNSKPYIWFNNYDANFGGGDRGFKCAYFDGAVWQFADWICFTNPPSNDMCAYPIDNIHDNYNVYVMNRDTPPKTFQYEYGKIARYVQTSGSVTDPVDRANFANYTLDHNIQINTTGGENVDGLAGTVGDLAWDIGFDVLEIDSNSNPVFLIVHNANSGGRHFSRLYANVAAPASPDDWTIQTPMAATNDNEGNPQALRGRASGTLETSPLQNKNQCHILVLSANSWITGHQARYYWVKHIINDWSGVEPNDWFVFSPSNPNYDFTNGNILT